MATFMFQKFKKYCNCYSIVLSFSVFLYLNSNTTEAKYVQIAPNLGLPTFDAGGDLNEGDTKVDDIDLYGTISSKFQLDLYLGKFIKVAMMTMKMIKMRGSPLTFKVELLNSTWMKIYLNSIHFLV
ncbi:hypothetical protein M9H77_07171 [Catharanthus roseus]|uniref:Uncharacterized protein n=1 Tax=Catharanthus roseus TaxID=4058 RepID=A0ACC0BUA4_CATRO|nr:hypothetical protein M9H77_07171 [Catharanthus roseus]